MTIARIIRKEQEHRLSFFERGFSGNAERIIYLSGKIEEERVRQALFSPGSFREKAAQVREEQGSGQKLGTHLTQPGVKRSKLEGSHDVARQLERQSRSPLEVDSLIKMIYSYVPYENRAVLSQVNYQFYANHLSSYLQDLSSLSYFELGTAQRVYAKKLRCSSVDVLRLQNSLDRFEIPNYQDPIDADSLASLLRCATMGNITTMKVTSVFLNNQHIIAIAQTCHHLQNIALFPLRMHQITDISALRNCAELVRLKVGTASVGDESIVPIAEQCHQLSEIHLGCCYVTDASILALAEKASNLTVLTVYSVGLEKSPTFSSFLRVVNTHPALIGLGTWNPGSLDPLVKGLTDRCPALSQLMAPHGDMTFPVLDNLFRTCRSLHLAHIRGLHLDARAAETIAQHGKALRTLSIGDASPSLVAASARLIRSLPGCDTTVVADGALRSSDTLAMLQFDLQYVPESMEAEHLKHYQFLLRHPDKIEMEQLNSMMQMYRDAATQLDDTARSLFCRGVGQRLESINSIYVSSGPAYTPRWSAFLNCKEAHSKGHISELSVCVIIDVFYLLNFKFPFEPITL
jgi:hypothetical protein